MAREGSVSAAARVLGISQPAVSRQLRLLQEERGTALYTRSAQGIVLTPAGRQLLPYACSVSQALERAAEVIRGEVEPEWTHLHLGLSHHLTTRYTGPLLRAGRAYTELGYLLRMHLLEGYTPELERGLREGSLDAAWILGQPEDARDLRVDPVGSEQIVLLVREDDPLTRYGSLPLSSLEGETLVVPSFASITYRSLYRALEATGTRPGRLLEVSGPAAVRSAVHAGLGIGVTVASYVETELIDVVLRLIRLDGPELQLPVYRLTRADAFLLPDRQHALTYLAERHGL